MNRTPTPAEMLRAFQSSDPSYDGIFWTAVKTTGIFCRPSCRARKPKAENVEFFPSVKQALFGGYRACKRCDPLGAGDPTPAWIAPLMAELETVAQPRLTARDLIERGLHPERVSRWFCRRYGMTFAAWCRAKRLGQSLQELRRGSDVDSVIFDSSYRSHSGFRRAFGRAFGTAPDEGRAMESTVTTIIDSPLGPLLAGARDKGVCLLEFCDRRMIEAQIESVRRRIGGALVPGDHPHLTRLRTELADYFTGSSRRFEVPLVAPGTPFQEQVWQALLTIEYGQTIAYDDLARRIGRPGASRAVGTANGMNRIAIVIPCHRVVNKNGDLGGYGGGLRRKQWLLQLEKGVCAGERPPQSATAVQLHLLT